MKLKSSERVLYTLNHHEPDKVPIFDFLCSKPLYKEVLGREPEFYNAEDIVNCSYKIGYDLCIIPFGGAAGYNTENIKGATYKDEWQTTYKEDDSSWPSDGPIDYPIKNTEDWKNYVMPDPKKDSRLSDIKIALEMRKEKDMAVLGSIRGPFSSSSLLLGYENLCILLYENPEFIDEVFENVTNFYIEGGKRLINEGVDAILIEDDYGSNMGPLLSPAHYRKHIFPQLDRMIKTLKRQKDIQVILHSDGNVNSLLDDFISMDINGYHPVEKSAGMNIEEIKQKYGHKLCICGNVNNKTTMVTGTKEDVIEETKECIKIAAPGGGFILGSDHSLHADMPNENIFALYEAGRKFGNYPIKI